MSLFVKKSGVSGYTEELARSSVIEVGQELQFRAVVRSGDGMSLVLRPVKLETF